MSIANPHAEQRDAVAHLLSGVADGLADAIELLDGLEEGARDEGLERDSLAHWRQATALRQARRRIAGVAKEISR